MKGSGRNKSNHGYAMMTGGGTRRGTLAAGGQLTAQGAAAGVF